MRNHEAVTLWHFGQIEEPAQSPLPVFDRGFELPIPGPEKILLVHW
jgi:hypothetical protein